MHSMQSRESYTGSNEYREAEHKTSNRCQKCIRSQAPRGREMWREKCSRCSGVQRSDNPIATIVSQSTNDVHLRIHEKCENIWPRAKSKPPTPMANIENKRKIEMASKLSRVFCSHIQHRRSSPMKIRNFFSIFTIVCQSIKQHAMPQFVRAEDSK